MNPSTALPMGRGDDLTPVSGFSPMFNFSANHLTLLSRTEYRSCAVFLLLDHSTHRVYRLHDFTKAHVLEPGCFYCVSGKVNSAASHNGATNSIRSDAGYSAEE